MAFLYFSFVVTIFILISMESELVFFIEQGIF